MAYEFFYTRRVEFTDVDIGGVMHFANYFRFMESAEQALFRALDLPIFEPHENGAIAWPRVRATCSYHMPLHLGDDVDIRVIVASKRRRSIELWVALLHGGHRVALGAFRNVCAWIDPLKHVILSIDIPPDVHARIEVAPPEVLAELPSPWR